MGVVLLLHTVFTLPLEDFVTCLVIVFGFVFVGSTH